MEKCLLQYKLSWPLTPGLSLSIDPMDIRRVSVCVSSSCFWPSSLILLTSCDATQHFPGRRSRVAFGELIKLTAYNLSADSGRLRQQQDGWWMDSVLPGCPARMSTTATPHLVGYSTTYRLNCAQQGHIGELRDIFAEFSQLNHFI